MNTIYILNLYKLVDFMPNKKYKNKIENNTIKNIIK